MVCARVKFKRPRFKRTIKTRYLISIELENETHGYVDNHRQISFRLPLDKKLLGRIMQNMEVGTRL